MFSLCPDCGLNLLVGQVGQPHSDCAAFRRIGQVGQPMRLLSGFAPNSTFGNQRSAHGEFPLQFFSFGLTFAPTKIQSPEPFE
jgi:hypothetical protein